jgi:hypothetical protein
MMPPTATAAVPRTTVAATMIRLLGAKYACASPAK